MNARELATSGAPLHSAASFGHGPEVAAALIQAGAHVNARNATGATPLHLAANTENTDILKVLLEAGADVSVRDYNGRTPLEAAEDAGSSGAAATLRRASVQGS